MLNDIMKTGCLGKAIGYCYTNGSRSMACLISTLLLWNGQSYLSSYLHLISVSNLLPLTSHSLLLSDISYLFILCHMFLISYFLIYLSLTHDPGPYPIG